MKLNKHLSHHLSAIGRIKFVLDIGFGYPFHLFEIYHKFDALACIGTDLREKDSVVSLSSVETDIAKFSKIDLTTIAYLIDDRDRSIEFYNSYKLYTALVLGKKPLDVSEFNRNFRLHFERPIQDYILDKKPWIELDVIIASNVLSHIDPNSEFNANWVLDKLLSRLSQNGIIYLSLRSEDYQPKINHGGLSSTILAPYDSHRLQTVLSKIDVLHQETVIREFDGKRSYEIIAKKKDIIAAEPNQSYTNVVKNDRLQELDTRRNCK